MKKRMIVCYCRISKDDRKKKPGTSPERLLSRFAKTIGVSPIFFVDNEVTQQEELQKLWNAIMNGKVRAVIVPSITHVLPQGTRRTRDVCSVLTFFNEHKVNFVCLREGLETSSRFLGLIRHGVLIRKFLKIDPSIGLRHVARKETSRSAKLGRQ